MLGVIGLPPEAETVYELLLDGRAATAADLATATGFSRQRVHALLRDLHTRNLIRRAGTASSTGESMRTAAYAAADPGTALETLLMRREEEIRHARVRAQELSERFHLAAATQDAGDVMEVVTGRDAVASRVMTARRSAQRELRGLDKPPYAITPEPHGLGTASGYLLQRGGTVRNIYERASVEVPGRLTGDMFGGGRRGEQDRVLPHLPTKLLLVDDRLAIVPLQAAPTDVDRVVVIHRSALLEAIAALFEALWQVALPLNLVGTGTGTGEDAPTQEDRNILSLLTAGLPDDAVARQLGLSGRTYQRRISDLMARLGARTRFQLARQATRRGWLTDD